MSTMHAFRTAAITAFDIEGRRERREANRLARVAQRDERDLKRGYSIDMKRVILAYLSETVIVLGSFYGAWWFATTYGHNTREIVIMMLAPVGYAVVEFSRVPLALSVRAHRSTFVRVMALIGLLCAGGVTIKSMSQLGEMMFRPRLFDVVHAGEKLQAAQATQATVAQQIAAADQVVLDRRAAFILAEQRAKSDAEQVGSLPKEQCHATSGTTRDGREYRGQSCKTDGRVAPLIANLKTTVDARNESAQRLDAAMKQRAALDHDDADHAVALAQTVYREMVLQSQIHSFAAMVYGVSPTEVNDQQVHGFLRIFVFLPAICVALASSLVAFTAVHRIKPAKPTTVEFDPAGLDFLLNPLYRAIVDEAVNRATSPANIKLEKQS